MSIKSTMGFLVKSLAFSVVFCAVAGAASWAAIKVSQEREDAERACKAEQRAAAREEQKKQLAAERAAYDKEMAERERLMKESAAQGEQMAALLKRYEAELAQRELIVKRQLALLAEQERRVGIAHKN
ncbi:hypothetical protein [Ralstonia sp. ASV6]|uniref:hypothetical protein n=1 Tax=Ralstonia sp. ASV6 TaxID=2795124 RepID=UPI0018ED64DA|nr:hypothetical protein [Ralstonia sp. ASV6]